MRISRHAIFAAEDDEFMDEDFMEEDSDNLEDNLDGIADDIEDMQDTLDDVEEDEVSIEADNNIENHYIAECDRCKGIFISAVVESDQEISKISGVCPLCEKETDQYLRWVVKPVE